MTAQGLNALEAARLLAWLAGSPTQGWGRRLSLRSDADSLHNFGVNARDAAMSKILRMKRVAAKRRRAHLVADRQFEAAVLRNERAKLLRIKRVAAKRRRARLVEERRRGKHPFSYWATRHKTQ